jgi:hypothetical protein
MCLRVLLPNVINVRARCDARHAWNVTIGFTNSIGMVGSRRPLPAIWALVCEPSVAISQQPPYRSIGDDAVLPSWIATRPICYSTGMKAATMPGIGR